MPFFSIVIPTYNRADFLEETINSALQQTFRDFEIVLIDDGSTDNTADLIREKFGNNPQVRYYYQENKERGAARNNGIKKSRGKYIIFFDSDDIMHDDHLITLYERLQREPDTNYIATKYDFGNKDKRYPNNDFKSVVDGKYGITLFLKGNLLACNFCVRKDNPHLILFNENRSFNVMEDWVFLIQNLQHEMITIIDKVTITMNDHDNRSMKSDNHLIIDKRLKAMNLIIEKVKLDSFQLMLLKAFSYYFCAIHSYLDNDRKKGLYFLWQATKAYRINKKFIALFLKILVGRRFIVWLKNR